MRINLTAEQFNLTIASLTRTHRELAAKADGWSYNLEVDNDFDEYARLRQQELEVAGVIHILHKQKDNPAESAEEPLADWEKELLSIGKVKRVLEVRPLDEHYDATVSDILTIEDEEWTVDMVSEFGPTKTLTLRKRN